MQFVYIKALVLSSLPVCLIRRIPLQWSVELAYSLYEVWEVADYSFCHSNSIFFMVLIWFSLQIDFLWQIDLLGIWFCPAETMLQLPPHLTILLAIFSVFTLGNSFLLLERGVSLRTRSKEPWHSLLTSQDILNLNVKTPNMSQVLCNGRFRRTAWRTWRLCLTICLSCPGMMGILLRLTWKTQASVVTYLQNLAWVRWVVSTFQK